MFASIIRNIKGDKVIWAIILLLSLVSILAIYSSTSALAFKHGNTASAYLLKQAIFVVIGFVTIYIAHIIPIGWYRRFALPLLVVSVVLLLLAMFKGVSLNGAERWLSIFGFTFQPADIARIGLILYVAKVMESEELYIFKEFSIKLLLPIGVIFILIAWSSTSTSLLLLLTLFVLLFIGGIRMNHLLRMIGIGTLLVGLILVIGLNTNWFPRVTTAVNRVTTFVDEDRAAEKNTFQSEQAKIAVATGGIFGKGPGNSTQRYVLPHPYSDFIYAIIIEEYGLLGGIVVLGLYWILLFRAIVIARSCTRVFPQVVVLGLVLAIVFQAMLNMAVAVGVIPVTGQTLPLVSLGGSSMLTQSFALGIVLSVSRATEERNMPQPIIENGLLRTSQ